MKFYIFKAETTSLEPEPTESTSYIPPTVSYETTAEPQCTDDLQCAGKCNCQCPEITCICDANYSCQCDAAGLCP